MRNLLLWCLGLLLVAGCAGDASSPTVDLPLAQGKPTFLFFYTDN